MTAMLSAPRTQTAIPNRRDQILQAVDAFKRVHDAWENDNNAPPQPSELFERALTVCVGVCQTGDIPSDCRTIIASVAKMGLAWLKYKNGEMNSEQCPFPRFWDTVRGVFIARNGTNVVPMRRPETVRALRRQNVPDPQIAQQIYVDPEWPNGKGPFLTERGAVNEAALDAEERANEKGESTLPKDWVQWIDRERLRKEETDLAEQLASLTNAVFQPPARKEDMDGLLREGQYVDVIARECQCSLDDVFARAAELGIEPQHRPNLAAERAPQEPEINPHSAAALDARLHVPETGADFGPDLDRVAGPAAVAPDSSLSLIQQVEQHAARGMQPEQILQYLGMTRDELCEHTGMGKREINQALKGNRQE